MKKTISIVLMMMMINTVTNAQQEKQFAASDAPANSRISPLAITYLPGKKTYPRINGVTDKDYDHHFRTSRTLRITGLSLLGAGLILGGAGVIVATDKNSYNDYNDELREERTLRTLFITSAAAGIASIPLMVMAGVHKRKANVLIENKKTGLVPPGVSNDIVGVTVKIGIGK